MDSKIKRYDRDEGFFPSLFRNFNDDFFNDFDLMPAANVVERKKSYDLDLQVPGFDKNEVHLEIDKNVLKISGECKTDHEEKDDKGNVLRHEFSHSSFSRQFIIPENIDTENITAKQVNGVLKIKLPKLEKSPEKAVKQIAVK